MLTFTGQNEDISHGLQIGKDQKGDNQRDENCYQFNNKGFNVKKTYLLVIEMIKSVESKSQRRY